MVELQNYLNLHYSSWIGASSVFGPVGGPSSYWYMSNELETMLYMEKKTKKRKYKALVGGGLRGGEDNETDRHILHTKPIT